MSARNRDVNEFQIKFDYIHKQRLSINRDDTENAEAKATISSYDNKLLGFASSQIEAHDAVMGKYSALHLELPHIRTLVNITKDVVKLAQNFDKDLNESIEKQLSEFAREESTTSLSNDEVLTKYSETVAKIHKWKTNFK